MQIRKNLGPSGEKPKSVGNKKTIQIVVRNKNIVSKKWDLNTIKSNIQECDIGIVPGVHDLTDKLEIVDPTNGKFETDYIFRFKKFE